MSIRAISWVWEHSRSVGNERLVLLAIADEANDQGAHAYPSLPRIEQKTKVSRRGIQRAIAKLVELGELRIAELSRGTHARQFWMPMSGQPTLPLAVERGGTVTPLAGRFGTARGVVGAAQGRHISTSPSSSDPDPYTPSGGKPAASADASAAPLVDHFVQKCRQYGYDPVRSLKASIGAEVKRLLREKPPELIRWALAVVAEEHKSAKALPLIVGELEAKGSGK